MKITIFVTFFLVGMVYASKMSCDSCGKECVSSCGSRRFRACCFNYLRKKRDPENMETLASHFKLDEYPFPAVFLYDADDWLSTLTSQTKHNDIDDTVENRMTL